MGKKRIALLLAQADEAYQEEFSCGVMEKANELGYEVYIFSMLIKYQNNKNREIGDSNIYNLISFNSFDGIVILADTIQTPNVEKNIEKRIKEVFDGPVILIDRECEGFKSYWIDGYQEIYELVSHLIEVHNHKDIAFLTGRKDHIHSRRRVDAYKAAMLEHGLEVKENRVFYGDFWYTSGTGCAEKLLRNRNDLPEAVACANDCMAIGLAEELERNGIRIPEDIAITGYGSSDEGQCSPKALTSSYIPAHYYGGLVVETIRNMMNGDYTPVPRSTPKLFIGETCGCVHENTHSFGNKRKMWMSDESENGYYSIHNNMMEDMLSANSVEELFGMAYESIYFLRGVRHLDIFLNDQWMRPEFLSEEKILKEGYSERMLHVISFDSEDADYCQISGDRLVSREELLPSGCPEYMEGGYIFLPLFLENYSYGYVILNYGTNKRGMDDVARLWIKAISRGLESFRRLSIMKMLQTQNTLRMHSKYPIHIDMGNSISGIASKMTADEIEEMKLVEKILDENLLTYHFQPIVKATDGEIFSYEGLMRSTTERVVPPLQIIKMADALDRLIDVEKATFNNILDIVEDNEEIFNSRKIFINSIPGVKLSNEDFSGVRKRLCNHAESAVVELTEQTELQDDELESLKKQYRDMGIGFALDDYGTGYSNVGNLLRYMPDYVKIDRSLLTEIQKSSQKQHFVREVIDFCHANNIMALAEGVETVEELQTVIYLGADLIQGYYVARPKSEIINSIDGNVKMEIARFHREKEDGSSELSYIAGRINRVSTHALVKDNKTSIVIGKGNPTFRDITIVGTPNKETDIHIEVLEGYDGRVTLENVNLISRKRRPCIHIADNAKLTLCLEGDNKLNGGGILVPESSKLILEGEGNLKIQLSGSESYAIGNSLDKAHGSIEFYQDGEITIESNGKTIIGIGSGLGGQTKINKGKYVFRLNGDIGVGIGSIEGNQPIEIHDCDLMIVSTFYKGLCIGNMSGNTDIRVWRSLLRIDGSGKEVCMLGSIDGENADIILHDLSVHLNMRADFSTGIGSRNGATTFHIDTGALIYHGMGTDAYVYGGNENTSVEVEDADVHIEIKSDKGKVTLAHPERIKEKNSRIKIDSGT